VGQGGNYVKHIQQKTRCKVQIKGRGSGFTELSTGKESDEPMYLHVAYVVIYLRDRFPLYADLDTAAPILKMFRLLRSFARISWQT
jgi:hypothetical protein